MNSALKSSSSYKKSIAIKKLKELIPEILLIGIYSRVHKEELHELYNSGLLDDSSIEKVLEIAVLKRAREDYNFLTRIIKEPDILLIPFNSDKFMKINHLEYLTALNEKEFQPTPDHLIPKFLAYGLEKGIFSEEEIKKIPFDYGETAALFRTKYGKPDLLSLLREELFNPKQSPYSLNGSECSTCC